MSNSWRISVSEEDRSSTIRPILGDTGAMVVRSTKGPAEPMFIDEANEQLIYDIFGYPSTDYPDVWEAVQYNKSAPIWISSAHVGTDTIAGVVISATGTIGIESGDEITEGADFTFGGTTDYFALFQRGSNSAQDLEVLVTYDDTLAIFTIVLSKKYYDGTWKTVGTYEVSLSETGKDGFGKNIFIESVFENNPYIYAVKNSTGVYTTSVDDSTSVLFAGGLRDSTITLTELTTSWDYFKSFRQYPANIFMDSTANAGIPSIFNTLRNSYQKYGSYLLPLTAGETPAEAISTKAGYSINNRGLSFFFNHGKVRNTFGTNFWTSLIGRIGVKFANMTDIYNAGAPCWQDENNHGGQLGGNIIELEYDPTEGELENLDNAGINPIIFDPAFGVMIVSQRTAKSPSQLSDDSWIAHSRMFDYILQNITDQVLTYQVCKLNDQAHRTTALLKGRMIMEPILAASYISDYMIVCDTTNNTSSTLALRQFIYDLAVKVTPYSEEIKFTFIKVGQSTDIQEVIGQ